MPEIDLPCLAKSIILLGLVLAGSAILTAAPASAQNATIIAIDTAQNSCFDRAQSDPDMQQCLTVAETAYDLELNRSFKAAIKILDPESAKLLRDAQRQWLVAREADRKVWRGPWTETAGTMANVAAGQVEAGRTRQRAIELGLLIQSRNG